MGTCTSNMRAASCPLDGQAVNLVLGHHFGMKECFVVVSLQSLVLLRKMIYLPSLFNCR